MAGADFARPRQAQEKAIMAKEGAALATERQAERERDLERLSAYERIKHICVDWVLDERDQVFDVRCTSRIAREKRKPIGMRIH
jgi:hypothetical protein